MNEQTIQLDIPLLVPDITDGDDGCLVRLEQMLENRHGIHRVHVKRDVNPPQLCLHFDPNLVSLRNVQRIAREAGGEFGKLYRHERIPFGGLNAADAADVLTQELSELPGMVHANANYAAGLAFVAYDTTVLKLDAILQTMIRMGARPLALEQEVGPLAPEEAGHDHGSAPAFLPHWMKERWTLILVGLAGLFLLVGWVGETFFGLPENVALAFYILAYMAGGYDIATHAIPGLLRGNFDTDVLMLAAAAGAALLGEWAEGAFLLFLFSLGHAGEHYALDRARQAVNALGELMPRTAQVKRGDEIVTLPVEQLQVGDLVLVRPGDRIPVDGDISRGRSSIDQSAITGESVPVDKGEGDEVFAGTINQDNALDITVTKLARDNTLSRIMQMVAEAQEQQSPTQQQTQRFTAIFVPAILVIVLLVMVVPPLFGWMPFQSSFYRAMLLLVASSPCALAIGTPAAVLAGIAQAARNGVLIKGGAHLENLGSLNVLALDKTGTLTEGRFQLTDVVSLNGADKDELLSITGAVEQQSNHPLALAVVRAAQERQLDLPAANGLENMVGRGVRSEVNGRPVLIGSLKLFEETHGVQLDGLVGGTVARLEGEGKTTLIVNHGGRFLGVIALADAPRAGVKETLRELRALGIEQIIMLTGDNEDVALRIGREVDVTNIRAELLPEDKLEAIQALQAEYGAVGMVGDGVNDAPALATATVGIAMGAAGTATALETADVALMADDLGKLPFAVGLSRGSRSIIRQNLVISLGVIGLLILTSVTGVVALSGAVVLHEGSTILVVLNALRLLRFRV